MLRNRAVALLIGLALSPLVIALGLGPMQSGSFLNESFDGEIEILGVNASDYDTLSVRLAPLEQFERAGIELNPILYALRFEVDGDRDVVRVTTRDPIREPYLNFLVEVNWAKGRLLREYTVLLDPPLYDNQRRAPAAPATTSAATTAPAVAAASAAASTVRPGAYSAGGEVGPIGATDTLWSIAEAYRPDDGITVQQMMLAILRENPDAFGENNINLLRRGAILRLPDEGAIRSVSASEAFAEAQRQHQLWEDYRNQVGAAPAPQPVGAPTGGRAPAEMAAPADEARLELAAPEGDEDGSGGDSAAGGSDTLLQEEIEARTQQSEELESKLTEAEEIIDLLQRQVNIQEDELAALQARLAELGIDESEVDIAALRQQAMAGAEDAAGEVPDEASAEGTDAGTDEDAAVDDMAAADEPTDDAETAMEEEAEADTAAAESTPKPAAKPAPKPAEPAARGFPESLVPEQFAALVPGGALTILGAIAVVLLGLFAGIVAFLMRRGGAETAAEAPAAEATAAVVDDDETEDPTVTAATAVSDDGSEDPTVTAAGDDFDPNATVESEEEFDPNATVEAAAAADGADAAPTPAAAVAAEEEDPLEEVNVYLAYERFEQAEELVTRVIGEYPDRHEYKLRLLEVYYSSNDRASYEKAARDLLDAVGEGDPLWDSAVAMWSEMSPDRALFAEGEDVPAEAPAAEAASAFVDITGDDDAAPGEDTVAHAPGSDDDDDAGVDFDLSSDGGDGDDDAIDLTATGDVLDLTAAADDDIDLTATGDGDVLDLTAEAGDDIVDLTGGTADGETGAGEDDGGVLDITSGDDTDGDVLDLTGGADAGEVTDLLDASSGGDLLDVTKTGDISAMDDADLLNVTSPGMRDAGEIPAASDADETSLDLDIGEPEADGAGEIEPDFDISETVATAFDESDATGGDVLDLTSAEEPAGADAATEEGGDDLLDFDIGGLDDAGDGEDASGIDSEATTLVDGNGLDAVAEAAEGGELDFDLTMGEDDLTAGLEAEGAAGDDTGLDLDLGSDDDELTVELRPTEAAGELNIEESEDDEGRLEITMSSTVGDAIDGALDDELDGEISLQGDELDELALDETSGSAPSLDDDFDIALEGTTEMDSIAADDTVDMASMAGGADEVSLDDLSSELDSALDDASLDDLDIGALEIEGIPEGDGDLGQLDTVQLENTADLDIDNDDEKTVVMPVADDVETQSDADEADTKLNLAKAYIELGDNEGARSILDEVAASGDDAQKQEAQALLDQLSG